MSFDLQNEKKELRKFGFIMSGILAVGFGLFLPFLFGKEKFPIWPWPIASFFFLMSVMRPLGLEFVFRAWMYLGEKLGSLNSYLIVAFTYWMILFPISIVKRPFTKGSVELELDAKRDSYRITGNGHEIVKGMESPF